MQYALLLIGTLLLAAGWRRIQFLHGVGLRGAARRLYVRMAIIIGGAAWLAMIAQLVMLGLAGRLSWQTALPLHLCSLMGVLTLPMLLSGSNGLWHASLYAGAPGALLALIFPSILPVPWMQTMRLAFFTLHIAVLLAPLLPLAINRRPEPSGILDAAALLLVLALIDLPVNALTGSNYLFLQLPASGTPLDAAAAHGLTVYRLTLVGCTAAVLMAEALLSAGLQRLFLHRNG